tara:strand:- start:499 stop:5337 length:4839 start_codon:yes stop_codon:yes gene_type:complete
MSVNEKLMAPGTFNVSLSLESTPNSVINAMVPWGNIVLTPTRINPDEFTDAQVRDLSRYVGIVQTQEISEEGIEIGGKGILTYLGDNDSRGLVLARNAGVGAVRDYNRDTLDDVLDRNTSTPYGLLRDEEGNVRAVRKGTVTEVSFDDTVLLLNFEGSNGDTTTTDGSVYTQNQVITFSGTADISSDQANYGNTSLNLTTDGFVTVADRPELDLTYQEFTVEWWEYRTSSSGNPTVMARNNDTYSPWIFGKAVSGRNKAFITHDGKGYNTEEDLSIDMGLIDLNQWNHFAISHKENKFRTYKNGVQVAEEDRPELFVRVSSDSLQIGKGQDGNFFEGYLDGIVVTRGAAKYWDAFTPSTSAPVATTSNKTYTGKHYLEGAYKALRTVATSLGAEFKINNNGTLDVGPASSLFTGHEDNEPQGIIVRRLSGQDPSIKGYDGFDLTTEFNAEDYVSRVELIANGNGKEINLGQADAKNIPYKDLFGNPLERIQILSENEIPDNLRDVRAEAYLNEYNKIDKTLNVGLSDYDISGDISVGDVIYVYDPEVGFEDTQDEATLENRDRYEITYQGQILNPIKIRIMGLSFPIAEGMGVYYRDADGNYTDITDYTNFEVGSTQIEVGSTTPNINEDLRATGSIVSIGSTNEYHVPDAPTNLTASKGTYQDGSGRPFAFARLSWTEPTNTDGSRITDGNMYRVRYRQVTDVDGNNLIDSNDNQVTDYEYLSVSFGTTTTVIKGLGVSNTYEFGVQAIDNSGFSGGYSIITAEQMPVDGTIPPAPVAPTGTFGAIASNAAQIQISHKLAAAEDADGNAIASPTNFTLPRDIDHLNVYRNTSSSFTPSASTFVGEIQARAGHIDGEITAINTFIVSTAGTWYYKLTAVDVAGNESDPSTAQQAEHELITKEYIADAEITTIKIGEAQVTDAKIDTMTAAKITAGTISGKEIIIDTDSATDPSNPVLGTIRSNNYVTNTSGWIIKSDGSVEFETGTFRGDLDAAGGTFSGDLSAAGGTFTGTLSGVDGNFTGTISATQISGGTMTADILDGGEIDGSSIDLGNGTFTVDTSGNMVATSATITGAVTATSGSFTGSVTADSGTIGGISINSGDIQANYSAGSSGFLIESDGDAFFNSVDVRIGAAPSATPSTGKTTLDVGNTQIYTFNNDLYLNTTGTNNAVYVKDQLILTASSSSASNMQLMFDGVGSGDAMGFWHDSDFPNSSDAELYWTNQSGSGDYNKIAYVTTQDDYLHLGSDAPGIKTDFTGSPTMYFDGPGSPGSDSATFNMAVRPYAIKDKDGQVGSSGQVLSSTGSRIDWIDLPTSGGAHADSDHTSFASTTSLNNHTGNNSAHGYSAISINGLTMEHGYGLTIQGSGDIGVSSSGNPHTITISHDDSDHSYATGITSLSVSGGAGFAITASQSGNSASINTTQSTTSTISTGTLNSYSHYPRSTDSYSIGSAGSRWLVGYFQFGTTTSDQRLKENIEDLTLGLDFINKLEPKKYNWKTEEYKYCEHCGCEFPIEATECGGDEHEDCDSPDNVLVIKNRREEISDIDMFGFMAQDVIAIDDLSDDNTYGIARHNTEEDTYDISYENMIAPLVKAVQELSAKNDELQSRIEELEG